MPMTIPTATLSPAPARSIRTRPASVRALGNTLPFPSAAPGEIAAAGLASWETYLELDHRMGTSGFRIRYLHGLIEIMSTSRLHELLRFNLARFLEAFCKENGIDYTGYGVATQQILGKAAGQPDESYIFGTEDKEWPDLIIEIALSSGGIDKLDFWATMKISEVWIWQNNRLQAFVYDRDGYQPVTASRWLPGIDFALMQELASMTPSTKAEREFLARMRDK